MKLKEYNEFKNFVGAEINKADTDELLAKALGSLASFDLEFLETKKPNSGSTSKKDKIEEKLLTGRKGYFDFDTNNTLTSCPHELKGIFEYSGNF